MIQNSKIDGGAAGVREGAPKPGTIIPRPKGVASGAGGSANPKTGIYAKNARAYMREEGKKSFNAAGLRA